MTRKTRKIILLVSFLIFIILSPILLLHLQGIRFDLEKFQFTETGGIFVHCQNPGAKIYLDGKYKKETSLILKSVLLKKLLPGKYQVEVRKYGYFPWQKNVKVEEGTVKEIKDVILFKKNPQFEIISTEVNNFWQGEKEENVLIEKKGELYVFNNPEKSWQKVFSSKENSLILEDWDESQKEILFRIKETKKLILVDYSFYPETGKTLFELSEQSENPFLNPQEKGEIIFSKGNSLFKKNKEGEELFLSNVKGTEKKENSFFWINSSGFLIKSDFGLTKKETLNKKPLQTTGANFKILKTKENYFLETGGSLYILNKDGVFENIFSGVKGSSLSPEKTRVVFWNEKEIWVGEKEEIFFSNRLSEEIGNAFWLTEKYLIFNFGKRIKISEADSREGFNNYNFFELENESEKELRKTSFGKNLFVLNEKNVLLIFENLLP